MPTHWSHLSVQKEVFNISCFQCIELIT